MTRTVIAVNISWNRFGWQKPYVDNRAGHVYAREHPGHESVNFDFSKRRIDNKTYIYGFGQWTHYPKKFSTGGYVVFYTRNLDSNKSQVVGIYGDVELLDPARQFPYTGFENDTLQCNMKAARAMSLLLPRPLDAKSYFSGRMVGRIGFRYCDEKLVRQVVSDEYNLLKDTGGLTGRSFEVLNSLYFRLTGQQLSRGSAADSEQADLDEQCEFEESESQRNVSEIRDELRKLKPTDSERIEVRSRAYKRNNKTIAQLKIVRGYKCQMCGSAIRRKDGSLYVEAAHITPKTQRGVELPSNLIILCPNHHKEFDLGARTIEKRDRNVLVVLLNGKRYSIDLQI